MENRKMVKLAYLVTHPIQYQAPLLRRIAREKHIDLVAYFGSDATLGKYYDHGFGRELKWDVPLLEGYKYEFLPQVGKAHRFNFWRPFNYGLRKRLKDQKAEYLLIHGYMRLSHLWAVLVAKILGIKVLVRDEATNFSRKRSALKRAIKKVFFQILDKMVDAWLAIGSANKAYYISNGIKEEKIFIVPYAVDNRYFQEKGKEAAKNRDQFATELGIQRDRPIILFASKLENRKRAMDLLRAYIKLSPDGKKEPFPYLFIVGDGEQRQELQKLADSLGWESILFFGFKNQSELIKYYDICTVFVLPSVNEPWGLVVNEAMNFAKPIIVSNHVGSREDLVKDGKNGYGVKEGDIQSLYESLRKICNDSIEARRMGEESLKIINKWSFEEDVHGLEKAIGAIGRIA